SCLTACYSFSLSFLLLRPPPISTLFPYTTLFRSHDFERPMAVRIGADSSVVDVEPSRPYFSNWRIELAITNRRWPVATGGAHGRSEEHTSELQSRFDLVCRLLLEKKKKTQRQHN